MLPQVDDIHVRENTLFNETTKKPSPKIMIPLGSKKQKWDKNFDRE